jgi:hypothetical protein
MLSRLRASTRSACSQTLSFSVTDSPPRSRSVCIRLAETCRWVTSVVATKTPSTSPESPLIGE